MHTDSEVVNVVIAGLGGQGVITASDILADVAFRAGFDVKKSEIHGMSQRGGSVASDVRFGKRVLSHMVPTGDADFLVVLSPDQVEPNRHQLKPGGILITPDLIDESALLNRKALNVALLGALSARLERIPEALWLEVLLSSLPEKLHEANKQAFALGRAAGALLTARVP
jgi:indolepyruvate ferredoxin oxidoreductase beta subunit